MRKSAPPRFTDPTPYQLAILRGLQDKPVWTGGHKQPRAKARAANKVAAQQRRINRRRA